MLKREYPSHPIIGVGGIIFRDESVLLVKRAQEPSKGQWSLPGGVVELGETLKEALMREIMEEVSINVRIGDLVRIIDRIESDLHRVRDPSQRLQYRNRGRPGSAEYNDNGCA